MAASGPITACREGLKTTRSGHSQTLDIGPDEQLLMG
jgi:hypothetical protein